MSTLLQFVVPFVTALLVLGAFHAFSYLHLQISEADLTDEEEPSL